MSKTYELELYGMRGHPIYFDGRCYRYCDTGEPTESTWHQRPCAVCKKHYTSDGHDPCLGTLPGVTNACCGHGRISAAYIQFADGRLIVGRAVAEVIQLLFNSP